MSKDESVYPMDDGNGIAFSGRYRDAIFGDGLLENPNHDRFAYLDNIQNYALNSSGYRGPEFSSDTDLLFSGCSFTYGVGIPENGIWGSILAEKKGMSYNNISLSGASIPWMTKQLFAYFKKYGNPKTLLCLFPNPTKLLFASNAEILVSDDGYVESSTQDIDGKKSLYNTTLHDVLQIDSRPEYSRKPHSLKDVINLDLVIQICMQNIRLLEQYCRAAGIEFYWSTWSKDFSFIIESQGLVEIYDFSHYVRLDHELWSRRDGALSNDLFYGSLKDKSSCLDKHVGKLCHCSKDCHSDSASEYGDSFYRGTDIFEKHPHFGVHRHIHIAEAFMKRMETK